jgi:hypothetical protein
MNMSMIEEDRKIPAQAGRARHGKSREYRGKSGIADTVLLH